MRFDDLQYGQSKAREIQDRRERRRLIDERSATDNKLKTFWAPKLWEQTRETVRQLVQAINTALGEKSLECDEVKPDMVVIKVANVASNLAASFDAATGRITLTLDDHAEGYDLEVVRGDVKLKGVGFFSPSQVAKMLVDKAASMVL
jgi:anti-sigma-K factor RskA